MLLTVVLINSKNAYFCTGSSVTQFSYGAIVPLTQLARLLTVLRALISSSLYLNLLVPSVTVCTFTLHFDPCTKLNRWFMLTYLPFSSKSISLPSLF